jgi:flagellar biosynthesis protein FlhG
MQAVNMQTTRDSMHNTQVIAVTGGKGGVGKSSIAVNLGLALTALGRRVVLLDADLGLANVDIMLGISARRTLAEVLKGECSLRDVMVTTASGMRIVPAASGLSDMADLVPAQHAAIVNAFNDLSDDVDYLIVDTAAGISDTVISFVRAAHEVLTVVCNEPTSITDAYALIKILNRQHDKQVFRVVTNMTRSQQEALALFAKLQQVTDRFIDVTLQHIGNIPYDDAMRKAIQRQKPVLESAPRSAAAQGFRVLAQRVEALPVPRVANGQLQFFMERLVRQPMAACH